VIFCIKNLFHVNNWLVRVIAHDDSTPINPATPKRGGKNPIYLPLPLAGEGRSEGGYNVPPSLLSSPLSLCDIPTAIFFVKVEGDGGEDVNVLSTLRCIGDIFTRV
jgi:hypothetical protein